MKTSINATLEKSVWKHTQYILSDGIIITSMIRSEGRTVRYSELGPSISNLVQLKLIESQHTTSNRPRRHPYSKNALSSNINTPSTANDLQNFHSCHIDKRREVNKPLASLRLTGKDRGCESATKILTLREIKVEEFKAR